MPHPFALYVYVQLAAALVAVFSAAFMPSRRGEITALSACLVMILNTLTTWWAVSTI